MIKELLEDKEAVIAFDIDGVLAKIEWDEYNHFLYNDEEWGRACEEGKVEYGEDKVIKKIQDFLLKKDISRIYVVSRITSEAEIKMKIEFANKYYNIPKENIYFVRHNKEKVEKLFEIKKNYPELDNYKLAMVDDTVIVLNDILEKSDFSTVHISSFLDL